MATPCPDIDVRDAVWSTDAHLWGPDVTSLGLDDEIEDIELGGRVALWLTNWGLATIFTSEADKIWGSLSYFVGAVASATSRRGLPFPDEWWPPSVERRAS